MGQPNQVVARCQDKTFASQGALDGINQALLSVFAGH